MKNVWLTISVMLNLALAWAAVHYSHRYPVRSVEIVHGSAATPAAHSHSDAIASAPAATIITTIQTNHFLWDKLNTKNFERYVADLRVIGCPEKTINDIIRPDIERLYTIKSAMVEPKVSFWASGNTRVAANLEKQRQQKSLDEEKAALLKRLGIAQFYDSESLRDMEGNAIFRFMLGPVPDAAVQRVMVIMEQSDEKARRVRDELLDILLPEDHPKIDAVNRDLREKLGENLTPDQIQEFGLRCAALQLYDNLEGFRLSPAELRKMAELRMEIFGLFDGNPMVKIFSGGELVDEARKTEFENRWEEYLGEARYGDYQRQQDPDYKRFNEFAEQQKLAPDLPAKVYEMKQLYLSEKQRLQANPSLSKVDVEARLAEISDSTKSSMQELLGASAYSAFMLQGNGAWFSTEVTK